MKSITAILGIGFGIILFVLLANVFLNIKCEACKINEISPNSIALNLFKNFLISFEALALLLTAAAVGAIILALKEEK